MIVPTQIADAVVLINIKTITKFAAILTEFSLSLSIISVSKYNANFDVFTNSIGPGGLPAKSPANLVHIGNNSMREIIGR